MRSVEPASSSAGHGSEQDEWGAPTLPLPLGPLLRVLPKPTSSQDARELCAPVWQLVEQFNNGRPGRGPAPILLRLTVLLLALCVVGAGSGIVALHEHPAWFAGLRADSGFGTMAAVQRHAATGAVAQLPTSIGAGDLTISVLNPSTGTGGSLLSISGAHLFGPDGYLVATFDGSAVPTSCASEAECIATVPAAPPGTTVVVRVASHSGISNGLTFRYQ